MLEISNTDIQAPKFKAAPYQQQTQMTQLPPMGKDSFERMNAKKKSDSKDKWMKAGIIAGVGCAVAFGIQALLGLATHKINKQVAEEQMKALKKQAEYFAKNTEKSEKDRIKEQVDELSRVDFLWEDFKDKKSVVPLDSPTTAESVREAFKKIIKLGTNLSDAAKEASGIKARARFYYVHGQPGTGKTYASRQLAQELDALFTCIKYSDLGSPFKDAASMKVDTMGKKIREMSAQNPTRQIVVCVDESDALFKKITSHGEGSGEERKIRSTVLATLDNILKDCPNVTIVTTSNYSPKSNVIDSANLRRLIKVEIPLSNEAQLDSILRNSLKNAKAIDEKFYESTEYKEFLKKLHEGQYSNGEAAKIAEEALDSFACDLCEIAEKDIPNVKFDIKYLQKGKDSMGESAASIGLSQYN